jgi:hypothetical protein
LGGRLYRISLVLLCLVMLSFHLMSGLFAKYSSTGKATDSAQVAKFEVNLTGPAIGNVDVTWPEGPEVNVPYSYTFTLQNNSDVAVHYSLELVADSLPSYVTAVFSTPSGDIPYHSEQEITLTFTVNWDAFTQDVSGASVEQDIPFTVNAHIEQIN